MPDVKLERKEIDFVIQNDPEIEGHDESKFIFTDISTSKNEMVKHIFFMFIFILSIIR